jgi:hypothetical protein
MIETIHITDQVRRSWRKLVKRARATGPWCRCPLSHKTATVASIGKSQKAIWGRGLSLTLLILKASTNLHNYGPWSEAAFSDHAAIWIRPQYIQKARSAVGPSSVSCWYSHTFHPHSLPFYPQDRYNALQIDAELDTYLLQKIIGNMVHGMVTHGILFPNPGSTTWWWRF